MAHMETHEIAALRATISTLPVSDDVKRTWLSVIRQLEKVPETQADFDKRYAEAMECYAKAKKQRAHAQILLIASALLSAATFGMLIGGMM